MHLNSPSSHDQESAIYRVTKRLRPTLSALGRNLDCRRIALVALSPDIPLTTFTRRLARTLSDIGPALHCNSRLTAKPSKKALLYRQREAWYGNVEEWVKWLHQQEGAQFILYEVDAASVEWSRPYVERADLILLIGQVGGNSSRSQIEDLLRFNQTSVEHAPMELVLLTETSDQIPTGTSQWLADRQVRMHHHVDINSPRDLERLSSLLAGRGIGLVLGGGGARTFAHIGVLRALEEAGVPIDMIGGTSGGALIAAQYARGWTAEAIRQQMRKYMLSSGALLDFVVPFMSLIDGKQLRHMLDHVLGKGRIEDLPLPFYCISTDLNRAEAVVHRQGRLKESVKASISIPGIGRPCFSDGRVLVDGGILNNLPVDTMQEYQKGPVLAVDVSVLDELSLDPRCDSDISTWNIWMNRLNPFSPDLNIPNMVKIVTRTMFIAGAQRTEINKRLADVYLRPPVDGFGSLDYKSFDQIVEIGYQYTRQMLAEEAILNKLNLVACNAAPKLGQKSQNKIIAASNKSVQPGNVLTDH